MEAADHHCKACLWGCLPGYGGQGGGGGKVEMLITQDGKTERLPVYEYNENGGIALAMYNTVDSIRSFARSCFQFALGEKKDLWFSTKDTISKQYDHTFKDIFQEIYDAEYGAEICGSRPGIFLYPDR